MQRDVKQQRRYNCKIQPTEISNSGRNDFNKASGHFNLLTGKSGCLILLIGIEYRVIHKSVKHLKICKK
jgi:hypothetical protein